MNQNFIKGLNAKNRRVILGLGIVYFGLVLVILFLARFAVGL